MNILFPSYQQLTASIIGIALPFTLVVEASQALTGAEINQVAEQVTVFIQGIENQSNFGSGVIIKRSGKTYTVLTTSHVLDVSDTYQITTPDNSRHTIKQVRRIPNVDLATFQFDSSKDYQIAKTGDSKAVNPTDKVYVTGFPKPGFNITTPTYTITDGNITTVLRQDIRDGYGFAYTNPTRAGMSGGPVFNEAGEVIAIHGRKEGERDGSMPTGAWLNLGIPIVFSQAMTVAHSSGTSGGSLQKNVQASSTLNHEAKPISSLALTPFEVSPKLSTVSPASSQQPSMTKQCRNEKVNGIVNQTCRTVLKVPNLGPSLQESSKTSQDSLTALEHIRLGNQSLTSKNYLDAVNQFSHAINFNPRNGIAYFNRGVAFYHIGNMQKSRLDFQSSSKLFKSVNDQQRLQKVEKILAVMK